MNETELIAELGSYFADLLSVPVRTGAAEDDRPIPLLLIEDWDSTEKNHHNSAHAGESYGDFDGNGEFEYEWYLNFSAVTRVEFTFRHQDEVSASELKDTVLQEFRYIRENPQSFHPELKRCQIGDTGNPKYSFTEPDETEIMLAVRLHTDHTVTRTASDVEADTLEQWADNFQFC